jgi:hypothetical protein
MKEQGKALQNDKTEIVFRSGGGMKFKIIGIILTLIGILVIRALLDQPVDLVKYPHVYPLACLWFIGGVLFFFYRSERRLNLLSRRWRVSKSFLYFKKHREGSFNDLAAVEVSCSRLGERVNFIDCLYDVKVKAKDGYRIHIKRDIRIANTAFYIAGELCEKLALPLENNDTARDNISEMIPEDAVPEPAHRVSSCSFDGDVITFSVPPRIKPGKNHDLVLLIPAVAFTISLLMLSAFAARDFWYWLVDWLESGKILELWRGVIGILIIMLPIYAVYWIFSRLFLSRETLEVSSSSVIHRVSYGLRSHERQLPKSGITAIKVRWNTFAPKPRIRDIIVCAGPDTILFGGGLPNEENLWIASRLRKILNV